MPDESGLGGLKVDHELEGGWLFDGEITRLRAIEDAGDIGGDADVCFLRIRVVREQGPGLDGAPIFHHRR
jgi:hypothetical protein